MYVARKVVYSRDEATGEVSTHALKYYKYDGWTEATVPLDLSGVVLFTKGERDANPLPEGQEWQWYGAYKRS